MREVSIQKFLDTGRKWESGASKRKRKAEMMQVNQAMSTSMMKFLNKTSTSTTTDLDEPNAKMDLNEGNLSNKISKYNEELTKEVETNEPPMSLDPGKWVFPLSGSQRHDLVQHGPQQMLDICDENYPLDNHKRHFSNFHYTRKLSNGGTQHRRWLVYSQSQDKIYCFPCTVFSNLQTQMIREGCCDWKHLSTILQRHEKSQEHMVCMIKWVEFDKRIKLGKTIDQENEKRIRESQKHCNIEEHFIGFIAVDSTTGEHLTNIILHELKSNGLDIQDCRGQGFDNGANMVEINKGVKTRILNINPKAFFAPCGCHSWNSILVDAAKSSITAKTFFGFIQKMYLLFSKSSKR
ncbi:hypothetical protein AGLY_001084 [Aphis glycines]|uniref:TTF-type domain-containing protein n=1 Tax=Aphis glycines TaxID=307491 RepID=A0A6G0U8T6_APHGL|nr:hypothetical protein AGLY_001084 [Aphis glycines]